MGMGYAYKCDKCGNEYSVTLGSGMLYPEEYERLTIEIKEGKYGEKLKALFKNTPYAAVDADRFLYLCKNCGHWEVLHDPTIYAPKDPEVITKKKYGEKTIEEWGKIPYMSRWDLQNEYRVLKRHYWSCPECGKRMRKQRDEFDMMLKCPECNTINYTKGCTMWD